MNGFQLALLGVAVAAVVFTVVRLLSIQRARRELALHCIEPDELNQLLQAGKPVQLYDLRQPLDLFIDAETIPGARRIAPHEILTDPTLIPADQDSVVYCTCPGEETSRKIVERALSMGFRHIRLLRGGLAAWKAAGYPVEPYKGNISLEPANFAR
ncbi:rhodanese-like domain-containing protein [Silvibacterium sp.]|uniref:rhodanese-like domain-containing protein n=1 Tax=Silvibacterium sp. TaxID=1964179 RepID=UPI0039E4AAF5